MKHLNLSILFIYYLFSNQANAGLLPFGIQTNIESKIVEDNWGWTECFVTPGDSFVSLDTILTSCDGDQLMMSLRLKNTSNLLILAASDSKHVTGQTPYLNNSVSTIIENGIAWYSNGYSWGFTEADAKIKQVSADINLHPNYENNLGMSWFGSYDNSILQSNPHLELQAVARGWAYNKGSFRGITSKHERVLYTSNFPTVTTVSEPAHLFFLLFLTAFIYLSSSKIKARNIFTCISPK